ncbi:MAG: hypothetical protein II135_01665 [Clostridia bacterium]|nr:hypothetical protein [Clostridia bacterium]MBQ3870051.1 hypothetical protein [Clostridia bacterium]
MIRKFIFHTLNSLDRLDKKLNEADENGWALAYVKFRFFFFFEKKKPSQKPKEYFCSFDAPKNNRLFPVSYELRKHRASELISKYSLLEVSVFNKGSVDTAEFEKQRDLNAKIIYFDLTLFLLCVTAALSAVVIYTAISGGNGLIGLTVLSVIFTVMTADITRKWIAAKKKVKEKAPVKKSHTK